GGWRSLTSAGVTSPGSTLTIGSGAPAAIASPFAMRTMPSRMCLRTESLVVRTVICNFTSLGMMLCLVPPWIEPTVTTAGSRGLVSRLTSVCRSSTMRAAMTMGSMVVCGAEPWPPLPWTTMSTESTLASASPSVKGSRAGRPAAVAGQCEAVSGLGKLLEHPVFEQGPRPRADLLGRLRDEHDGPLPLVLELLQHAGRADPAGHVHVVPAGVHD